MTSVNLPPPPTAERPESFEERQDDLKEFRDNADGIPPRNLICVHCSKNGHWAYQCEENPLLRRDPRYVCKNCGRKHGRDDCPYRTTVRNDYICKNCKNRGHHQDDCPKRIRNRRKVISEHMKYSNLIRIQEGEEPKVYS